MFKDKVLLITGGTGSFGNAVVRRFLDSEIGEIRIFSRDEKKQDDMRNKYSNNKLKFYVGDVRSADSIRKAMRNVDYVFHAAALKQVPSCEFYPLEAINTNVLGTENVLEAAIGANVKRVICLSTDKAVYPINAMGMSKALMEKIATSKLRMNNNNNTIIAVTRYGNVMCSRGSVIPLFVRQISSGQAITITDPNMTRFMMTLEDAINLVLFAFETARGGEVFVQKAPACTIEVLAKAINEVMGKSTDIKYIGTRHGEKLFESLLTREEMARAAEFDNYYMVPLDDRELNYANYLEVGKENVAQNKDYTSHNTVRLDCKGVVDLLHTVDYIKEYLKSGNVEGNY